MDPQEQSVIEMFPLFWEFVVRGSTELPNLSVECLMYSTYSCYTISYFSPVSAAFSQGFHSRVQGNRFEVSEGNTLRVQGGNAEAPTHTN